MSRDLLYNRSLTSNQQINLANYCGCEKNTFAPAVSELRGRASPLPPAVPTPMIKVAIGVYTFGPLCMMFQSPNENFGNSTCRTA